MALNFLDRTINTKNSTIVNFNDSLEKHNINTIEDLIEFTRNYQTIVGEPTEELAKKKEKMETVFKYENQTTNYGIFLYKEEGILYGISGSLSLIKDYRFFCSKLISKKEIAHCLSEIYKITDQTNVNLYVTILMNEFHKCLFP